MRLLKREARVLWHTFVGCQRTWRSEDGSYWLTSGHNFVRLFHQNQCGCARRRLHLAERATGFEVLSYPEGSDLNPVILHKVTVVIRSVGERTEEVCRALILEQGVPPEAVFVVRQTPFSRTLRAGTEIGLEQKRPWTLFVDADLLLRPGSIRRIVEVAEAQAPKVCQVQGYCLDKFFGGVRPGGIHLYRTSLMGEFLSCIPDDGADIRPETRALTTMASKGFPWYLASELVGLHAFEQSYEDIFRTCFVHAHKYSHLFEFLIPYWRSKVQLDGDYRVALAGFSAGIEYSGLVRIDKKAPYLLAAMARVNRLEKNDLPASAWNLNRVEETVIGWDEPESYWDFFPAGMPSSGSGFIGRAMSGLQIQIGLKGALSGILSWLGTALLFLSKKSG